MKLNCLHYSSMPIFDVELRTKVAYACMDCQRIKKKVIRLDGSDEGIKDVFTLEGLTYHYGLLINGRLGPMAFPDKFLK